MQKKRRFGMKNVIASVLTAALVLTSTPSGIFAGELLVDEAVESGMEGEFFEEESPNTTLPEETPEGVSDIFGEADPSEVDDFSVSEDDYSEEDGEDGTEADATDNNEVATETAVEAVTEGDTAEVTETNTEAATDAEIEFTTDVETEAEEVAEAAAAEVNTVTVEGIRGWGSTYFTAELTGATVTVSIPTYFWGTSATSMQASYVDATGYEEMIDADNYGKVVSGLKAIELTFFDKRGKVVKSVSASAEVELGSISAETYVMYQKSRKGMKKTASSDYPYFSFNISNGGPFVFAGLADDGADRAEGVTSRGTTTFDLTTSDGTEISAYTSSKAFSSGTVYMEAENAMSEDTVEAAVSAVNNLEAEVVQAMDISFHNEEGTETEPAREVTVTIAIPLTMEGEYQLVHIKDNGDTEIVEDVAFDENGVTFTVDEFSTFVIVAADGSDICTVHFGVLDSNGNFTELADTVSLDQSAASMSLDTTFSGYHYVGAYYNASATSTPNTGTAIDSALSKSGENWQYKDLETSEAGTIAVGSHIYACYQEAIPYQPTPAGSTDIPKPTSKKNVTPNGDGTYTIQLDIIGQEITSTETKGANVLMIFDRTSSMSNNMSNGSGGSTTRFEAAISAVNTLVTALDPANNPVEMAFFTFDRNANAPLTSGGSYWFTDGRIITDTVNSSSFTMAASGATPGAGGTNWEAAFTQAQTVLNEADSDPTYIIFLTDGNPTIYVGSNTIRQADANSAEYLRARNVIRAFDAKYKIYGILCANQTDGPLLNTLINYIKESNTEGGSTYPAHDATHILANRSDILTQTFQDIADYIVSQLGATDVSTNDGVTSLSSTSATVNGAAGAFEYYITPKNGTQTTWADAPGASYSAATGVTWDLAKVGKLEDGTTYTLKFTVWPSQEAYDLIADLNNGLKNYEELHADTKKQVHEVNGIYYLRTNTNFDTTYTFDGKTYTDPGTTVTEGDMKLDVEKISLVKEWPKNLLDDKGMATYRDKDGNEKQTDTITLSLYKDNADDEENKYLDVTVRSPEWKDENVYISCGFMTVKTKDGQKIAEIREPGHDYIITEPSGFSYYWDLVADVYHPMVINGTAEMLVLDEKATTADNENSFEINGKIYKKQEGAENTLYAKNYRRSNLNLTKVVSTATSAAQDDDYFTYTAKVTDAFSTDGLVWFSAFKETGEIDPETGKPIMTAVTDTDWVLSEATSAGGGYWSVANGTTVTFKIKKGWNIRFLNLYHGSTFEFVETGMPESYVYVGAAGTKQFDFEDTTIPADSWRTITDTDKKVSGTIIEPNNSYTVTYTNKFEAFYIYHSGVAETGNLEVIPMSDCNDDGTYNLYAKTTKNTLYGGYYLNYTGKGNYKDDGVIADGGTLYSGSNNEWIKADGQTVDGRAMTPVAFETYYIKEVPYAYLQNYCHYTYVINSQVLTGLYLLSAIDDLNYKETGFYLQKVDEATEKKTSSATKNPTDKVKIVTQVTYAYQNNNNNVLTPVSVFGGEDRTYKIDSQGSSYAKNRLTYWDANNPSSKYFDTSVLGKGETIQFTMQPYWITRDGIEVVAPSIRTVKIAGTKVTDLSKNDSEIVLVE